ncbi:cobalt-precorrin-8X methylmutase [filamentous cyanobacterium CCP5]|nr:cobalt-precorrin-8X methylmutase [filamentous cyanobacterium CCP5]
MPALVQHPILQQSFAVIDREFGPHNFSPDAYAITRRVIHSTADFEYKRLIDFSETAIAQGIAALQQRCPIVVDVTMVRQGVLGMVNRTFQNPVLTAVTAVDAAEPGLTRTETGLLHCWEQAPEALYVIGNAPTALLALCDRLSTSPQRPALVVGAPVGFIAVEEAKGRLAELDVPQIRVEGRKGGSPVAAAILNALLVLAWERL